MRNITLFVVVLLIASAGVACADELNINIPHSACTPNVTCTLDPYIQGMGSPAEGSAIFPLISLAAGPWQFNFMTGDPLSWSYYADNYSALFGVGGSFQMTAPDKLTFSGQITGGKVNDRFEYTSADLTFDGLWANNQYASGELVITFLSGANNYFTSLEVNTTEVPEPASLALLGSGISGVWAARKRFRLH